MLTQKIRRIVPGLMIVASACSQFSAESTDPAVSKNNLPEEPSAPLSPPPVANTKDSGSGPAQQEEPWSDDESDSDKDSTINKPNSVSDDLTQKAGAPTSNDRSVGGDQSLTKYAQEPSETIWSEGEVQSDFVRWISESQNQNKLAGIGVLDNANQVLDLHAPVTLSFTQFAQNGPFLIRTNGNDLTLVGSDFGYLKIDTSREGGNSGQVKLYSAASSLPIISTSGTAGAPGANGQCAADKICAPVGQNIPKFTLKGSQTTWSTKEYEHTWDWNDSRVQESWKQRILQNVYPETSESLARFCQSNLGPISINGPMISGQLKMKQTLIHPEFPADLSSVRPVDSELFPAEPGHPGNDGGHISIIQLGQEDKKSMEFVRANAGSGGQGGENLMSAASDAIQERTESTYKIGDKFILDGLTIEWSITCPSAQSRFPTLDTKKVFGHFFSQVIHTQTEFLTDSKSIALPAVLSGRELPPTTEKKARAGANGKPGTIEIIRTKSPNDWKTALHPLVPIPKGIQF